LGIRAQKEEQIKGCPVVVDIPECDVSISLSDEHRRTRYSSKKIISELFIASKTL